MGAAFRLRAAYMENSITRTIFLVAGIIFAAPCLFFIYYAARLAYINLTMSSADAAAHRTGGMLIGAVAFPLAVIVFGAMSWFCFKRARRSTQK
jgi:hypothetical protein